MNKENIIYDNKANTVYNIKEKTTIYTFLIDESANITINLEENANVVFNLSIINIKDNNIKINVNHYNKNSKSIINVNGLNTKNNTLKVEVSGFIPKDITGCSCVEKNHFINLMEGKVIIVPKLIIDNFDTQSSHSAYIGPIDKDKLFYLMMRGINELLAKFIIIESLIINTANKDELIVKNFIDKLKEEIWIEKQEEE